MKYIGITIGSINTTMQLAKAGREIWSASYIFSYLMREIIKGIYKKTNSFDVFIQPYAKAAIDADMQLHGAGIFSDRLLIKENAKITFQDIQIITDTVLENIAKETYELIKTNTTELKDVIEFFKQYFQIYIVEAELSENENPTKVIGDYLNTLEVQKKFIPVELQNYLSELFYATNRSFLFNDAYPDLKDKKFPKKRFESIIEIATREFSKEPEYKSLIERNVIDSTKRLFYKSNKEVILEEEQILNALKGKFGSKFRTYHKYIAIVSADGDNIGEAIRFIYENENVKDKENIQKLLQKSLFEFAKAAANEINNYKGKSIYVGGDDLLFLSPVKNGSENIFNLIEKLDSLFANIVLEDKVLKQVFDIMDNKASMSYGVSISYYKYPLSEALQQAHELLNKKAKSKNKNAIAFSVLKHSGTEFSAVLSKSENFINVFRNEILNIDAEDDLLKSVIYKLDALQPALIDFVKKGENIAKKVHNLRNYSFDEPIHKTKYKDYLDSIEKLIVAGLSDISALATHNDFEKESEKAINKIYGSLRMVNFLLRKDNDK